MPAPSVPDVRFRLGERAPCWRVPVRAYPPEGYRVARQEQRIMWYPTIGAPTSEAAIERVRAIYGPDAEVREPVPLHHAHWGE